MEQARARIPIAPPLYQRLSLVLIGLFILAYALSVTKELLIPLLFSLLLAILLDRIVKVFCRWGMHRVLSIFLAVTMAMLLLIAIAYFVATQAAHFSDAIPQLKAKVMETTKDLEHWIRSTVKVDPDEIHDAVNKLKQRSVEQGGALVGKTLSIVGALFAFLFLLPVFTFLILYYKNLFHTFLVKLFARSGQDRLEDVLTQTKTVVQSFLVGRMVETLIVLGLNCVGLLLIGVKYALLLATLGALMNLVPYVGMVVATVLTMVVAFALQSVNAAIWVFVVYGLIQFIDNHFLVPLVVGARVQTNAFFTIVVVIAGGMLWGVPGMFLSIPITGILKVIFDRVPALEPWGYVLGTGEDEDEKRSKKDK